MNFLAHASSSAGNAYTVTEDGCAPLLVECGLPRQQLQRALEFKTSGLAGCLISHHHGDHARALGYVACAGVDCYMSVGTAAALGVRSHRIHQVEPRRRFDVGPWQVMPFDLRHDAGGTLGFLIASPAGDRLLYACDTAYVPYRFEGLTHVAIEANYGAEMLRASELDPEQKKRVIRNHMSIERALDMLAANDLSAVRAIWLLHLSDSNSDERAFKTAVEAATGKPTHVAPARSTGAAA